MILHLQFMNPIPKLIDFEQNSYLSWLHKLLTKQMIYILNKIWKDRPI